MQIATHPVNRPLCYCGVPSRLRHSWTNTNFGRKWYGCKSYKEMVACEKRLMERLNATEQIMRAEIVRLETELTKYKANMENQSVQMQLLLELYCTKDKNFAFKMYQAAFVFVILLLLFFPYF
jgi:hypothetical protein